MKYFIVVIVIVLGINMILYSKIMKKYKQIDVKYVYKTYNIYHHKIPEVYGNKIITSDTILVNVDYGR